MLTVNYSNQFKKDVKQVSKRGYNMNLLYKVMKILENEEVLNSKYKEHQLIGNYKGYLECHIKPNWLLIYKIIDQNLYFARTGTHTDLFK